MEIASDCILTWCLFVDGHIVCKKTSHGELTISILVINFGDQCLRMLECEFLGVVMYEWATEYRHLSLSGTQVLLLPLGVGAVLVCCGCCCCAETRLCREGWCRRQLKIWRQRSSRNPEKILAGASRPLAAQLVARQARKWI